MLLSTLLFATMSALVKLAAQDVSIAEIVLFRSLPSMIALYAFAHLNGLRLRTPHWRLYAVRCLVGVAGMGCGYYAIRHLPLATAATLEYTAPLFLVAAHAVLRRRLAGSVELVAVAVGFAGVLMLLRPSLGEGQLPAFLAGLVGGGTAAIAYRSLRALGEAGEPGWRIVFIYAVTGVLVGLAALPFAGPSTYTPQSVVALASIGATGLAGQLAMTHAFRCGPTSLLATLQYATIAFSACYGALFWGEFPSLLGAAGLGLIVVSGIVAARGMAVPRGS